MTDKKQFEPTGSAVELSEKLLLGCNTTAISNVAELRCNKYVESKAFFFFFWQMLLVELIALRYWCSSEWL